MLAFIHTITRSLLTRTTSPHIINTLSKRVEEDERERKTEREDSFPFVEINLSKIVSCGLASSLEF